LNKPTTLLDEGADRPGRLEQAVTVMVGLFVFLTPFPHTTALKEATFYLPLAGMLVLALWKKKTFSWSTPLALPFAMLAAWGAAGLFFALDRPNTLYDLVSQLLKYYAVYFLVVQFYPSQKGFDTLARIIVSSTAIFSVGAIVYFYPVLGHAFSERLGHSKQYSFFEMSTNYMCFATIFAAILASNLLLKEKRAGVRALLGVALVSVMAATMLTQTRGALIAIVVGVVVLFLSDRRRLMAVLAGFGIFVMVLFASPESGTRFSPQGILGNERISMIRMYLEMVQERPVAGIGFGMEILQRQDYMKQYYDRVPESYRDSGFHVSPHNLYLDVLVRLGVVGLLLYLAIAVIAFRMTLQASRRNPGDGLCMLAAWTALLIQAFFADASFGAPAIVFYLNLAMITILWKAAQSEEGLLVAGRRLHMNWQGGGMMLWRRVTKEQTALIAALREEVLALPDIDRNGESGAETAWLANRRELRRKILEDDPLRFLDWDVVTGSMFVGNRPFIDTELSYLMNRPDWKQVWEDIIEEDPAGDPKPYKGYKRSSGNRIHQAYHLCRFEEEAGLPVSGFPLIVEFGGGYGSLCRLAHKRGFSGLYVIFDLPECVALQKFYLGLLGMPLIEAKDASRGGRGILCTSDLAVLAAVDLRKAEQGLFIATWSLSETGVAFREQIVALPAVDGAAAYLIAYQREFEGVDNRHFFDAWRGKKPTIRWAHSEISHMPGNFYLFGRR